MDFLWIMLFLISVMIVVIVWAVITDNNKTKKQRRLQALYAECATPGKIYEFYGANGGGDSFKVERYRIVVLSVIDNWVKYSEDIYLPNAAKPHFSGSNSTTFSDFYKWLSIRNAKEINLTNEVKF